MPNVPNIVRERLKAATSVSHPDADVLTAFAERSLPVGERDVVLEHIARCGECREVLALALPTTEEVQVVLRPTPAGVRGWLTWPALRSGFVAAGIALIGSLGVVQYQRAQRHVPTASNAARHNEVAANQAQPTMTAAPPPAGSSVTAERRDKAQSGTEAAFNSTRTESATQQNSGDKSLKEDLTLDPKRIAPVHVPQGAGNTAGPVHGGPAVLNQQQTQNQLPVQGRSFNARAPLALPKAPAQSASAPGPTASKMFEVQSASAQADADKLSDQPKQNGSDERLSMNYSESGIGKAKLPVASQSASGASAVNAISPLPLQAQPSLMRVFTAPLPRWSIGANGNLQRSYDGGKTWQDVNLTANPAPSTDSLNLPASNFPAKKDTTVANLTTKSGRDATAVFRAVTASGADVWAGGNAGALYHSLDAGAHWTRIMPSYSGSVLTGDIVTVQFSDAQNGKVTTSNSEAWVTADDGQTWQKQ